MLKILTSATIIVSATIRWRVAIVSLSNRHMLINSDSIMCSVCFAEVIESHNVETWHLFYPISLQVVRVRICYCSWKYQHLIVRVLTQFQPQTSVYVCVHVCGKSVWIMSVSVIIKWGGQEYSISSLSEEDTVMDLKQSIKTLTGVLPERQKLLGLKVKGERE